MAKLSCKLKIKNALGLHARPATLIAKLLQGTRSSVSFTYKKQTINARSIMSMLILAAPYNSHLFVTVEGEDAEITMEKLQEAFNNRFGE